MYLVCITWTTLAESLGARDPPRGSARQKNKVSNIYIYTWKFIYVYI